MINLNILDRWCNTFLPKTKEGELTNTSQKIKDRLVDVAFLNKTVVILVKRTGTDIKVLNEKNIEMRVKALGIKNYFYGTYDKHKYIYF